MRKRDEPFVTFSFDELDAIVGGLPPSAHAWGAWWTNSIRSRPHSRFWLDAGRRVSADLVKKVAVFTLYASIQIEELAEDLLDEAIPKETTEYASNSLSSERDLEDQKATCTIDEFSATDLARAFSTVAELAGVSIPRGDIEVIELPEPHRKPSFLPKGEVGSLCLYFWEALFESREGRAAKSSTFLQPALRLKRPEYAR